MSTELIKSPSLQRMLEQLLAAKLDPESAARIMAEVEQLSTKATNVKIAEALGEEEYQKLSAIDDDEEKESAMSQAYMAKTGKTIEDLSSEMLDKIVQDFEKS